ncbi:MAG: transposase [Candidatus Binatia bacterium]
MKNAIRPWQHRCWIFPRDPDFAVKAGCILDLYARRWEGKPLGRNDFVISTDEKTSIQARHRIHPTLPPASHRAMRVEHEYERGEPPYKTARRVFWIMDNGSSHRGSTCVRRLHARFRDIIRVHGPVHASWLNQIEIYFSIIQRKVLTPNDFASLDEVEDRLFRFQEHYERIAVPFEWKFTRIDLDALLERLPMTSTIHYGAPLDWNTLPNL